MFAVSRGRCLNNVLCFAMFSLAAAVSRFAFDVRNTASNLNCTLVYGIHNNVGVLPGNCYY